MISSEQLVQAQQWRCAVKVFDPKKAIPEATWAALEDALVLTPSSYGMQPWRFIVITDKKVRETLKPLSWNQSQVTDCSHFVVFAGRTDITAEDVNRLIQCVEQAGLSRPQSIDNYRAMIMKGLVEGPGHDTIQQWVSNQVYIALSNLMTSAAILGVDTCPMEGIEPKKYDQVLGLEATGYATLVACAVGYRSDSDAYAAGPKVRFPKDEVVVRLDG